jgi:short subunit dehydrogenase-like uncharacterized protein
MDAMARSCTVVCSAAGPFSEYGTPVIEACVRNATNYCDITGEAFWVKQMADRFSEECKKKQIFIVPMCGYDSIPSDLGIYYLNLRVKETYGFQTELEECTAYMTMVGPSGFSGGSIKSGIAMESIPDAVKMMELPFLLNDKQPKELTPHEKELTSVVFDKDIQTFIGPGIMSKLNSKVVRRSQEV